MNKGVIESDAEQQVAYLSGTASNTIGNSIVEKDTPSCSQT